LIDRAPPSVGFPTAVYSPKHRSGRCLLMTVHKDRPRFKEPPQGHRRLRFSFFLHLSKSRCLTPETQKNLASARRPRAAASGGAANSSTEPRRR
jgi:hypothetical protein